MSSKISDANWFALSWYGQTLDHACKEKGLVRLRAPFVGATALLPGVESGHMVAASPELVAGGRAIGAVVGGPCIGDCVAFPTLESLYDTVQLLSAARALGVPALVYLGDREEVLYRGGGSKRWARLADRFADWVRALAEELGVQRVSTVRTSSGAHYQAVAAASGPLWPIAGERLDRAFHLGHDAVPPGDDVSRQSTGFVVEAHRYSVVARHVEVPADHAVLVTENLQQAGAFALARELEPDSGVLYFAGHLPAPSLSGSSRMYRATPLDKLAAWDLEAVAAGESPGVHAYTREFFDSWLNPELRSRLCATARSSWVEDAAS